MYSDTLKGPVKSETFSLNYSQTHCDCVMYVPLPPVDAPKGVHIHLLC